MKMKRVYNTAVEDLWFDGLHYWRGEEPDLSGPIKGDLHSVLQQITRGESNTIELDKTTLYSVKSKG